MSEAKAKRSIATYFRDQAAWYRSCSTAGTARAQSLDRFAAYLEDLPASDVRATMLCQLAGSHGGLVPGPALSTAMSKVQDYEPAAFDDFLETLIDAAVRDCVERPAQTVDEYLVEPLDESDALVETR